MLTLDSARPSRPRAAWKQIFRRLYRYGYPLQDFQDVTGSPWEREAALQHNRAHLHLLVDTLIRWWAAGVWLLVLGQHLKNAMGHTELAQWPLGAGALLLTLGLTPLAGFLVLRREA